MSCISNARMGVKVLPDFDNIEQEMLNWLSEKNQPVLNEIADPAEIIQELLDKFETTGENEPGSLSDVPM